MTRPFFSVIFCVNRNIPFLKEAIDSILSQSYRDFEFLIGANPFAGGTVDEALMNVLLSACANDQRVQIQTIGIPQLPFCLNYLAQCASGEYLVRMDADDVSLPYRFARMADFIKKSRPDVIGSWATLIDESGKSLGNFEVPIDPRGIRRRMIFGTALIHPSVAIRREFFLGVRGYSGGLCTEDYDFWLRALRAGAKLENIPQCLLKYRVHSSQVSGSKLARAERLGHWVRELCLSPGFFTFGGLCVALAKVIAGPRATESLKKMSLGSRTAAMSIPNGTNPAGNRDTD